MFSYILVYVDDLLIICPTKAELDNLIKDIKNLYELRVADKIELFLGVEMKWKLDSENKLECLKMTQSIYTMSVLRRFGMQDSRGIGTPMVESFFTNLKAEEDKSIIDPQLYQQVIGSLLYLALRTRPDILASVLILARFQKSPTAYCHRAAKRILRYLKGTLDLGIMYTCGHLEMKSFVDADFAGDTIDRKSMSGYVIKIGNASIHWGSKKQSSVALNTCESEYFAISLAAQESIWLKKILIESRITLEEAIPIKSDNQAAIAWTTGDDGFITRAKHIDVRVHFIRDLVKNEDIDVSYISSEENDADILTKPLGRITLEMIRSRIGVC